MGRPGRKRRLVLVDEYWAFSRPVSALVRPADWQDRMVPTDHSPQLCATDSCGRPAVFRSRAKPTWCPDCLEGVYRTAGLRVLEPPTSYTTWHLTSCLQCGVEAHYRLQNIVDQTALGTLTCQGCRWINWAESTRQLAGIDDAAAVVDVAAARAVAERHGYEYLRRLTDPSLADDPHHVKCRTCGRLSAERLSDIGWGCACSRNSRSAAPVQKSKTVLSDSDSPALAWWDHDRNDSSLLISRTPKARLSVSWQCPTCGHRFDEQINAMTDRPDCPACRERREAESSRQHAEWARTPVSAVAELAAAWDDEADPDTVMVSGDWQLRRFRCAQGHHLSLRPSTFLESGCPSCSALATRRRGTPTLAETMPEIASQWNPDRNTFTAADVNGASRREVWWRDPECGHEWRARVVDRDKYQRLRCPECRTVLDSLAWQFPSLAGEWSVENSLTAWHVRPTGRTAFVPQ